MQTHFKSPRKSPLDLIKKILKYLFAFTFLVVSIKYVNSTFTFFLFFALTLLIFPPLESFWLRVFPSFKYIKVRYGAYAGIFILASLSTPITQKELPSAKITDSDNDSADTHIQNSPESNSTGTVTYNAATGEKVEAVQSVIKDENEDRTKAIEKQFSSWDGSHMRLERYIKKQMNDPGSYEHVKTTYSDNGTNITVVTQFRGKNSFGAIVLNTLKAKVDIDGEVLEIIE